MSDAVEWRVHAAADPEAIALVERGIGVSYGALLGRLESRLEVLRDAPPVRLAITPGASVEGVLDVLAAGLVGMPFVPLHPKWSEARRQERAAALGAFTLGELSSISSAKDAQDPPGTYALLHTSGSSGQPKVVRLSRAALAAANAGHAQRIGWQEHDRWGLFLPPAHIGGLSVVMRSLCAGKAVVFGERLSQLPMIVAQQRITLLSLVPAQLHQLVGSGYRPPPHLRAVLVGGAALSPALKARALALGIPVHATYGMSETCAQMATALPHEDGCGRALEGVELCIRDGEIAVRGATLMDGYLRDDGDETVLDPARDEEGYFRTGDLGELRDGVLFVRGRKDDRIISGGENVDPALVEAALARVDGVQSTCVIGAPDERWGQKVVAFVVFDETRRELAGSPAALSFDEFARGEELGLADYERPKAVIVVHALPVNDNGKVDRRALRARFVAKEFSVALAGAKADDQDVEGRP